MTVPIKEDQDRVLSDRPNDAIYPKIKCQIEAINALEEVYKDKIVEATVRDMAFDLALSNALDTISEVISYVAQERGIEQPSFYGDLLMKNVSRISKLRASLEYADLLNIAGEERNLVIEAEIERLWEMGNGIKKRIEKPKENPNDSKIIKLLENIAELLEKKKPGRRTKTEE